MHVNNFVFLFLSGLSLSSLAQEKKTLDFYAYRSYEGRWHIGIIDSPVNYAGRRYGNDSIPYSRLDILGVRGVAEDLKLTESQSKDISNLKASLLKSRQDFMKGRKQIEVLNDEEGIKKIVETQRTSAQESLKRLLLPHQFSRLNEIMLQKEMEIRGVLILRNPVVKEKLALTDGQQDQSWDQRVDDLKRIMESSEETKKKEIIRTLEELLDGQQKKELSRLVGRWAKFNGARPSYPDELMMLLRDETVRHELTLKSHQIEKARRLQSEMRNVRAALIKQLRAAGKAANTIALRRESEETAYIKRTEGIEEILSKEQHTRLNQLFRQKLLLHRGIGVLNHLAFDKLKITERQKKRAVSLQKDLAKSVSEKVQQVESSILKSSLAKIISEKQRTLLKMCLGPRFVPPTQENGK